MTVEQLLHILNKLDPALDVLLHEERTLDAVKHVIEYDDDGNMVSYVLLTSLIGG